MIHRRSIFVVLWLVSSPLFAQEQSVKPGINDTFKDPNVEDFIGRFEKEGREPFDRRQEIVDACRIKPGMTIADIGAGTGLFTGPFSKGVGAEGRVYAVDIAEKFLRHIESKAQSEGLTNVVTVLATPESVNLSPKSVDLAFICDTYHHFEFPQKLLATIHRALKPGGQLILIDFRRIEGTSSDWIMSHVRAGQDVFVKEVEEAGFRQVEEDKDLLKESYFVRFEKAP
ncbi:MAG TPA: class I SAM-dependent methyltransferase [Pirellulales bacterium]|nr:class I SAM-dependent methyltransferase [Pirellulales bacterium]